MKPGMVHVRDVDVTCWQLRAMNRRAESTDHHEVDAMPHQDLQESQRLVTVGYEDLNGISASASMACRVPARRPSEMAEPRTWLSCS